MPDEETILTMQDGWDFVFQQGALFALLPTEDWLRDFERAETVAPILDPTLYREYLYSGKGEVIQDVLRAAHRFQASHCQSAEAGAV